jgi:hypothetical protein
MIRYDPNVNADLLRSTHIVLLTVVSAQPGPWVKLSSRTQERRLDAVFQFDQLFKGEILEQAGSLVSIALSQFAPVGPFITGVPGPWSPVEMVPGARLVVFSISGIPELQAVLGGSQPRKVEAADSALPDVDLALQAGTPELSLPRLLADTADRKQSYGPLFAAYLSARLPELFARIEDFDAFMVRIEDPALSGVARRVVFPDLYSRMIMLGAKPPWIARLMEGTFRILALPDAGDLGRNLIGTYLPRLLGVKGGADLQSADEIFAGKPSLRDSAQRPLEAFGAVEVLQWLRS